MSTCLSVLSQVSAAQGTVGTSPGSSIRTDGGLQPPPAFVHENWTVSDGLPVNSIQRLQRGSTGYLWLATWDGLVRFDGNRFAVFNSSNVDALPSNRFADMIVAPDGALWLRTEQDHLVRLQHGRFTHFGVTHGLRDRSTRRVLVDSGGVVLVGTLDGAYQLAGDTFARLAPREITGEVTALLRGAHETVWVGTRSDGLYRVQGKAAASVGDIDDDGVTRAVSVLRIDHSGTLWVGTSHGVYRVVSNTLKRVVRASGRDLTDHVTDIRVAPSGEVWVTSESGVFVAEEGSLRAVIETPGVTSGPSVRFAPDGSPWYAVNDRLYHDGRMVFQVPLRDSADSRTVTQIQDFAWDPEGSVWIGTYNRGLYRLKPSTFQVFSAREGVADRNVTSVLQDNTGAMWIGTFGRGLSRLENGEVRGYPPERGYPHFVLSLMQARDRSLWVGTLQEGVWRCQLPQMRCSDPGGASALRGTTVRAMHEDSLGNIWVGTEEGLFRQRNGRWERMAGASSGTVRGFLETEPGTLFMSTNGSGVLVHHAGRFSTITTQHGLPSDLIRSLYLDRSGRLWVGTEGRGLARVTTRTDADGSVIAVATHVIRERDGLFDEVIHQMLPDSFGRLWMSSNRGVFWVSMSELNAHADGRADGVHSTSFTERDGMRNREANGGQSPAGIVDHDGRLWFATQDGAVMLDPARARPNPVPPPVVIEQLSTATRTLTGDRVLSLEAAEREFEIEYAALSFLAPENVQFRYRLDGFSDEWTNAGNRRTAFFTNVPPGEYTFRVLASNNDGVWNDIGASLDLRVAPYFHETFAAYVLLALTLALLAAAIVQWRLRQLHHRERELRALVDERTVALRRQERQLAEQNAELASLHRSRSRLFANLSHEFRTPLTLIAGPLQSLGEGRHGALSASARDQVAMMLRNAQRLLQLINRILDLSRIEQGGLTLDRQPQDLIACVRDIIVGFAALAEQRGVALHFDPVATSLLVAFDEEQLEKVFLNLLSNAIKFTPAGGIVRVSVRQERQEAVLEISDTGFGIPEDQLPHIFERFYQGRASGASSDQGSGIGLSLSKEVVELHGGVISVASTVGVGSVFTVRLPLADADAAADAEAVPEVAGSAERDADRVSVLVIDDSGDMRTYVRSVLEPTYQVLECADGKAGLAMLALKLPDLVIADVMMPELDGLAFSRAMKSDAMTDAIPLILLTARAALEDQLAGLHSGADLYLTKPFDPPLLLANVQNLLGQRALLRERFRRGEQPTPASPVADRSGIDQRLRPLVAANLHDPHFGPESLAQAASLSYHQLYRALRDEMASTPSGYIRGVRAEIAADLLLSNSGTVTQVAYAVGFESLSYFRRAFRERFGVSPSEYIARSRGGSIGTIAG